MTFDVGQLITCDHVIDDNGTISDFRSMVVSCPRCAGYLFYYDFVLDPVGNIERVTKTDLLQALSIKSVITELGSNPFHINYGTSIAQYPGTLYSETFESVIRNEIINALKSLRGRQLLQEQLGQTLDPDEEITEVTNVRMRANDALHYTFYVDIRSAANSDITLEVVV